MVSDRRFSVAVVAIYQGLGIAKFFRHRLRLYGALQSGELPFHVHYASTTDRTTVRRLHVFIVASLVNTVAASHENHRLRRGKHVLAANWAIAVGRALNATMGILNLDRHADTARLDQCQA